MGAGSFVGVAGKEGLRKWGVMQPTPSPRPVRLLISQQPTILFSQNKPVTSNQPAVLFSQNKSAPVISHQPNEQAAGIL
jgi:hypothetical protein